MSATSETNQYPNILIWAQFTMMANQIGPHGKSEISQADFHNQKEEFFPQFSSFFKTISWSEESTSKYSSLASSYETNGYVHRWMMQNYEQLRVDTVSSKQQPSISSQWFALHQVTHFDNGREQEMLYSAPMINNVHLKNK